MLNSSNNTYLIIYLIIILILLYTITYVSSYTCNMQSTQSKEKFDNLSAPTLTPNDFTLVAVGYANQLYVQDIINNSWSPNLIAVQNSQSVIDVSVYPNGSLVAIGTDYNVYTKQSLNASWVKMPNLNNQGNWKSVSVANDGQSLLLINKGGQLFIYNTSTNKLDSWNQCCFCKIIQLQDNTFVGVGGGGCDTLYTMNTIDSKSWPIASKPDVGIISIAQTPSGQIIGLNKQGIICIKGSDWNTWTTTNNTGNFSAIAVSPIPPQTIGNYSRQGAFKDDSSRTIPNFIGNFNTLPECINAAQSQGYNTVGYQFMTQCFGGNNSPYDKNGFETNNALTVSSYPGAWTNIVYTTNQNLTSSNDPSDGEVFVYTECQFGGSGSKLTIGQYPNLPTAVNIKSVKLGQNTKLTLYSQSNFQGSSGMFFGSSDQVNKDAKCIDFTFMSAKVEKYNALPSKPSDLTNAQLSSLWTQVGCKAESMGFNAANISSWRNKQTVSDVVSDMKNWANSNNSNMKIGCYSLTPQPNVPGEGEVVLFDNCDYGGKYKKFGMGNVAFVGNDFNDITSSIKIGPYTSLTVYKDANFGGKSLSWKNDTGSVSTIACLKDNDFNDMLSSLKVSSSSAEVNNTLHPQSSPVFVLGSSNMSPWNLNFVDTTAKWI